MRGQAMLAALRGLLPPALLLATVTTADAAMGLKCSEWLQARAYVRYDVRTKQFIDARPKNVAPIPKGVDEKLAWANWYLAGRVSTLWMLDQQLAKIGSAVGVSGDRQPQQDLLGAIAAIDDLCRGGLLKEQRDYDVAELIDLQTTALILERANKVMTMLEKSMEAGRRQGR